MSAYKIRITIPEITHDIIYTMILKAFKLAAKPRKSGRDREKAELALTA